MRWQSAGQVAGLSWIWRGKFDRLLGCEKETAIGHLHRRIGVAGAHAVGAHALLAVGRRHRAHPVDDAALGGAIGVRRRHAGNARDHDERTLAPGQQAG